MTDFWQYFPILQFTDPNKRIYWPYLLLCVFYALIFLFFSKIKIKNSGIRYWFHPSARLDYMVWIFNHVLQITVLPLLFINSLAIASQLYRWLLNTFGEFHSYNFFPDWCGVIFYSLTFFIITDFSRYWLHFLMHHNRYLWYIHRTHHTAEVLTPITLFRVHPLEMVLYHIRYLFVHSTVTAIFIYIYQDVFDFPTILGASFFVFISNVLGGNLRHSHIPIGFGFFERLLISPKQHQMHHSKQPEMQQSNYGSFFAFWDILFSTWKPSKGIGEIEFGLNDQPKQVLWKEFLYPVIKILKINKQEVK